MHNRLILSSAVVIFSVLFLFISFHVEEDAFIYYRYAVHSARGDGLVFNIGERVEGFSSPLWMALLVLVARLNVYLPLAAPLGGLLFGIFTVLAVFCLMIVLEARYFAKWAASLTLAICYPFILWSQSGLETPLYAFFLTIFSAVYLYAHYPGKNKPSSPGLLHIVSGVLIPLVAIARPEGLLLLIPVAVDRVRNNDWKGLGRYLIAVFLIYGSFMIIRFINFGGFTANTSVKIHPDYLGRSLGQIITYFLYLGGVIIIVPLLASRSLKKEKDRQSYSRLLFLLLIVVCVSIIFTLAAGGDYRPFFRFLIPTAPVLLAVFWKSCEVLENNNTFFHFRLSSFWIRSLLFVMVSACSIVSIIGRGFSHSYWEIVFDKKPLIARQSFHQHAVGWIVKNVPSGSTVAYGQMGQGPYFALEAGKDIHFIDTLGLTDRYIGKLYRWDTILQTFFRKLISLESIGQAVTAARKDIALRATRYLLSRGPDFFILETVFQESVRIDTLLNTEEFISRYDLIDTIPEKEPYLFLVYGRRR